MATNFGILMIIAIIFVIWINNYLKRELWPSISFLVDKQRTCTKYLMSDVSAQSYSVTNYDF
ncbi:hypothetical protein F5ESL0225_00100 [Lactobacillus sp. ESL0225]|nr:hypothetical protein F5ESL0237_00135 [Lactobacillus sp. ESL0237]RMC45689.1 hypothetical protein F5ESL0234_00135 [Lactobacillus sp. ESL0234]RMC47150.1 hypothetical protein F5ESL0236_00135 [Lactobacillus sp. ESL0236]RMC52156.1 hypothetical protein F5ESL0225_00100 [Lactobacillus sp. ESL0225]